MELLSHATLKQKGVVLLETALILFLGVLIIFTTHVYHAQRWRKELIELQNKRVPYNGVKKWK